MSEAVILVGLQASGKTSFFRTCFASTHGHISKDNFRNARRRQDRQMRLLREALEKGRPVVVDNTNVTRADRGALIAEAKAAGARVLGYFFESDAERSLERNRSRFGKARVPERAIFSTLRRFEAPSMEEGFDRMFRVRLVDGRFRVTAWEEAG